MNQSSKNMEFGLLRMYEKLLGLSKTKNELEDRLEQYKKLALKVYNKDLDSFKEKINKFTTNFMEVDCDFKNIEEEILELKNIINEYYKFIQNRDRMNLYYKMYKHIDLFIGESLKYELDFSIDLYVDRMNKLEEYLNNNKKISTDEEEVNRLKNEFTIKKKRKDEIDKRISELNKILRNNFILSEGRILNNTTSGVEMIYASIQNEYRDIGINIRNYFSDNNNQEFLDIKDRILKDESDAKNLLDTASIVTGNENITNSNLDVLNDIKNDYLNKYYKKILIEILDIIKDIQDNYNSGINERKKLDYLILEREKVLKELGYNYAIDPFSRIKLDSQLSEISNYENIDEIIKNINDSINILENKIIELKNRNLQLDTDLKENIKLMKKKSISNVDRHIEKAKDNEVINIKDISSIFRLQVVKEKTNQVINNVINLINRRIKKDVVEEDIVEEKIKPIVDKPIETTPILKDEEDIPEEPSNPELVIEEDATLLKSDDKKVSVEFIETTPFEETPLFEDKQDDDIFVDMSSKIDNEQGIFPSLNLSNNNIDFSLVSPSQEESNSIDLELGLNKDKKSVEEMPELFFEYRDTSSDKDESKFDLTQEVENLLQGKSR